MKNPLQQLYDYLNEKLFHCEYWRGCPYYNRERCCDAWIMGHCGKYRTYNKIELEQEKKF
jgi:hypothetical protein